MQEKQLYFKSIAYLLHDIANKRAPAPSNTSNQFTHSQQLHSYYTLSVAGNFHVELSRTNQQFLSFMKDQYESME